MSNAPSPKQADDKRAASVSNFIRQIIEADLASGKYAPRHDSAKIRTRFPPEPNGYLHIGHAKSICLNFGLARDYDGACHLRFDDTNPATEEQEYVDSIIDAVHWLGFSWENAGVSNLFYASDYFDKLYAFAELFIGHGLAYVDSQSADEIRANRGTLTEGGKISPYRGRSAEENLKLFREMRDGKHADGMHVLRLKIDMASPNINLRDPAIYRIRHAHHHRTGDKWCVYPLYDYTHCISDALENITHSICTLEFEDHRPLYDWVLAKLADLSALKRPLPQQIEFARLNLTYVVLSKRRLIQLVDEKRVEGWNDPLMPTLAGARRRGYMPEGFRLFVERIGVAKADSWIEYSILEDCMRETLNDSCERRIAVLDPLRLVIDNYPTNKEEMCEAPNHPQQPELGKRTVPFAKELWIEREDFMEIPSKGFFRLSPPGVTPTGAPLPGSSVRLRYGYVVKCVGYEKDASGNVTAVHCEYDPDTKSGTAGADKVKVKGNIHWVSARHAYVAEVRLYDRLFKVPHPGEGGKDYLLDLNPNAKRVITGQLEPGLKNAKSEERFQFERHGYFVVDSVDSQTGAPIFNRTVTLRDSWGKK